MYSTPSAIQGASGRPDVFERRKLIYGLPSLSGKAKAVLGYLDHCVNTTEYEKTGHAKCYPSRATIAGAVGFSVRTVFDALEELAEARYINVWHRQSDKGSYRSNYYAVRYDVIATRSLTQMHKRGKKTSMQDAHKVMQEAHKGYVARAQGLCDTRIMVMHEPHTNIELEQQIENANVSIQVTSARNADEPRTNLQTQSLPLGNAERSEAADLAQDQSSPVRVQQAHNIPPAPPIPPPPSPAPVAPEPPKPCTEGCGRIASRDDHLCATHRAERQAASAERMRTRLTGQRNADYLCSVEGCERQANPIDKDRVCDVHRNERKHHDQRERLKRQRGGSAPIKPCAKDGCTRSVVGPYGAPYDTLCNDHLPA